MLEVRDLAVTYGSGRARLRAVRGVDLTLRHGETLGLVGESGSGKSSVARALVGLIASSGGTIEFDGQDFSTTRTRRHRTWRQAVQMVFQDPYSSLNPRMTIGEVLREATRLSGDRLTARDRRSIAQESLRLVGLDSTALDRYPSEFSGGQRQRIALSRALAADPKIIILDEVTSALDVSVQANVINLLRRIQVEKGISYLFISHDLSVVDVISDRVGVMYLGQVVESGDADVLLRAPSHPYTKALIDSIPQLGQPRKPASLSGDLPDPQKPPSGCSFHGRCPIGPMARPERQVCVSDQPVLGSVGHDHVAACHFPLTKAPAPPGESARSTA